MFYKRAGLTDAERYFSASRRRDDGNIRHFAAWRTFSRLFTRHLTGWREGVVGAATTTGIFRHYSFQLSSTLTLAFVELS